MLSHNKKHSLHLQDIPKQSHNLQPPSSFSRAWRMECVSPCCASSSQSSHLSLSLYPFPWQFLHTQALPCMVRFAPTKSYVFFPLWSNLVPQLVRSWVMDHQRLLQSFQSLARWSFGDFPGAGFVPGWPGASMAAFGRLPGEKPEISGFQQKPLFWLAFCWSWRTRFCVGSFFGWEEWHMTSVMISLRQCICQYSP